MIPIRTVRLILYPLCAAIIFYAAWNLIELKKASEASAQLLESLSQSAHSVIAEPQESETPELIEQPRQNPMIVYLNELNQDAVAWLTVEGTRIDYPVMQTPGDPEFYLHNDFNRNYSDYGTPFLDAACDLNSSENLIIYAHHMNDGSMFQNLMYFRNPEFCTASGTIHLMDIDNDRSYRPVIVMLISAKEAEGFPFYRCTDLKTEGEYNDFITGCQEFAVWQSDELPSFGQRLITLCTCEYTKANGRLVVVGAEYTD